MPVLVRYRVRDISALFREPAAMALPVLLPLREKKSSCPAIRPQANGALGGMIPHLVKRPVGRPSPEVKADAVTSATGRTRPGGRHGGQLRCTRSFQRVTSAAGGRAQAPEDMLLENVG